MLAGVVRVLCSVRAALTITAGISVAAVTRPGTTEADISTPNENSLFKSPPILEATRKERITGNPGDVLYLSRPPQPGYWSLTTRAGLRTDGNIA
jgi:hypothetical protein